MAETPQIDPIVEIVTQLKLTNELLAYTCLGMIPQARRQTLMATYGISFTPVSQLTPRARRRREQFLPRQTAAGAAD